MHIRTGCDTIQLSYELSQKPEYCTLDSIYRRFKDNAIEPNRITNNKDDLLFVYYSSFNSDSTHIAGTIYYRRDDAYPYHLHISMLTVIIFEYD